MGEGGRKEGVSAYEEYLARFSFASHRVPLPECDEFLG